MKDFLTISTFLGLLAVIWFFAFQMPKINQRKAQIEDLTETIDSVRRVNEAAPDTVIDTIVNYRWDTVTTQVHDTVIYEETDSGRLYFDTLRTPDIRIWTSSLVEGRMNWNSISFQQRVKQIEMALTINNKLPVPMPQPMPEPEPNHRHLYLSARAGVFGLSDPAVGAELIYTNDRNGYILQAGFYKLPSGSLYTIGAGIPILSY